MSDSISRQDGKIKVAKGQDPYNVIGNYIREHLTVIEDMIAVIRINDSITNELFLVDWHEDSCFVWHHDWWEGEENVELIDFFPVSDSERLPEPEPCEDAVPRTSVEYICRKNTVSTNPYEHKYHDKFIQFMDDPEISDFGRWQYSNGFNTALVAVKCDLDKVPSAQQQTLYGYKIEHLAYIAKVMEKEGITAEYAARTFDDMSRAIRMIIDETQQKLEEVTKHGYKVVHVSTDSIKVADAVGEPKSACSDCQEFDCYGCEHKEESK